MTIYQKCIGIINDTCLPEPSFLIENVFFGFISVVCGMGIASAFVSHLIKYTKDVENDDDSDENGDVESTDESMDPIDFADKFYEELNSLAPRDFSKEELDTLQFNIVDIDTPDGQVKMTYNNLTGSFWYYTNNKNILYKYLDAVARFFAIEYKCRQICVNYKEEIEKGIITANKKLVEEEKRREYLDNLMEKTEKTEKLSSVFAKLKNYKTGKNIKKTYYVLTGKSNIFKFAGSLEDYELSKNLKLNCIPMMDYSTFKKMLDDKNTITTM